MKRIYDEVISTLRRIGHDEGILLVMVGAPLIYATIYSAAYAPEVIREVPIAWVDLSHSPESRSLAQKVAGGSACRIAYAVPDLEEARHLLYAREVYGIVFIPPNFAEQINGLQQSSVTLFLDGGYFLIYRALYSYLATMLTSERIRVEVARLIDHTPSFESPVTNAYPLDEVQRTLFNPITGYGSYVDPAILILILQQTLWLGIGMLRAGKKAYALWETAGQGIAVVLLYLPTTLWLFAVNSQLFYLPNNGSPLSVMLFLLLYLLVVVLFALATSRFFRFREEPLLLLFWCSIPLLMISGVSFPQESMPSWLYAIGRVFPSSPAIEGYIRLRSMGASCYEIREEIILLFVQLLLYGMVVIRSAIKK